MARRFILALLVALVISGAAVFIIYRKMARTAEPVAQTPIEYVAAGHPVNPGDILKREDLTMISWPRANPLAGSFVKADDLVGRVALYPLQAGQPVLDSELAAAGAGMGLSGRVPEGMRAIALRSDEVVGVAGFLMPATHVDVLVTYKPEPNMPDPITATVLQDAEVLAVGHEVQPDPSGKPANVDVVTLLLSPQDAEKAVLAAAQGSIHFVLRRGGDNNTSAPIAPVYVTELSGGVAPKPARAAVARVARPEAAPKPKSWVVETQLGTKAHTTESFN
ncbi:MAG TPA: Flp pilus assembly protein CpaB [Acidobacteriaceae bacterium]|nr:Flp pilus assembly protein CpaB [Acidobacteriaceae bacterium]